MISYRCKIYDLTSPPAIIAISYAWDASDRALCGYDSRPFGPGLVMQINEVTVRKSRVTVTRDIYLTYKTLI
jgi:hypothetical protein